MFLLISRGNVGERGALSLLFDPPDWAKSNLPLLFEVRNLGMGPINKRNKRNERFKIKKIFVKYK